MVGGRVPLVAQTLPPVVPTPDRERVDLIFRECSGPTSHTEPPDALVAGRADIARHAIPGLNITIHLDSIVRLLKEDANYCATAFTAEQASELAGRDVRQPTPAQGGATWTQTPEGLEADRAEKAAARARYRAAWGTDPV